jgi:CRP/FNR family transcriptional regulator
MTGSVFEEEPLFQKGRRVDLARGEVLHTPHEKCRSLGLVVSGSLRLVRILPSGREAMVREFLPGDLYGELLVFNRACYPGWLIATEPAMVREVDLSRLLTYLQNPETLTCFMGGISRKMIRLGDTIEILSLKTVRQRIAHVLLTRPSPELPWPEGRNPLSITRLAATLGCTREAASRALAEMKREGLVESKDGHLLVTNPAGLEDIL